jgi:Ca2+-binding EF-hand superfamily protein
MTESDDFVDNLINKLLNDSSNLATEIELREQASCATKAYYEADADGTGYLTSDEIGRLCEEMGLRVDQGEDDIFLRIDSDGSDEIDLHEWLEYWMRRVSRLPNPAKQQEVIARNTFKKFDSDSSGSLDISEFDNVIRSLGAEFSDEEIAAAISELDSDHSGKIEQEEFVDWWCNRAKKNRQSGGLIAIKLRKLAMKANQIYNTDIFTATWNNDRSLVKSFVDSDPRLLNAADDSDYGNGWTALHYACYQGHEALVEYMLEQASSSIVNKANNHGFTPLFYAAQHGHIDICRQLLDRGADPSICGMDPEIVENQETIMCPAHFCSDYPELYDMFIEHAKCTPPKTIPISKAYAAFTSATNLSIELPNQKSYTSLPIAEYMLKLSCDDSFSIPSLEIKQKAPSTRSDGTIDVVIDKKWLQRVFLTISAASKEVDALSTTIEAVNVMGSSGPVSDSIRVDITKALSIFRSSATKAAAPSSSSPSPSIRSQAPSLAAESRISQHSQRSHK